MHWCTERMAILWAGIREEVVKAVIDTRARYRAEVRNRPTLKLGSAYAGGVLSVVGDGVGATHDSGVVYYHSVGTTVRNVVDAEAICAPDGTDGAPLYGGRGLEVGHAVIFDGAARSGGREIGHSRRCEGAIEHAKAVRPARSGRSNVDHAGWGGEGVDHAIVCESSTGS